MTKFKLIAQHYDMSPGTVVYKVGEVANLYTVDPEKMDQNLRIIPAEKVEKVVDH
jgi:hypothetical protein